ncbi:hypothetical protein [Streptomyces chartreusis]
MSIDLVRYRLSGDDLLGLETVASVSGRSPVTRRVRRHVAGLEAAAKAWHWLSWRRWLTRWGWEVA